MINAQPLRTRKLTNAEKIYTILAGFFMGAIILTNVIGGKLFLFLGEYTLTASIIAYPITFIVTDIISEIFGKRRANQLVLSGFILSVFATLMILVAGRFPVSPFSPVKQEAYANVFGIMPGIVMGSMFAYLVAQFVDVQVFEWLYNKTNGKHLWLRNNGSTMVSQLVDSVLVHVIAFELWFAIDGIAETEPWPLMQLISVIFTVYGFKVLIAAIDTPIVYLCVRNIQKYIAKDEVE